MDDDVKNLFQKFGQTTPSYQEINRDADSEQARQRWPLLRDVRVSAKPETTGEDTSVMSSSLLSKNTQTDSLPVSKVPLQQVTSSPLFSRPQADDNSEGKHSAPLFQSVQNRQIVSELSVSDSAPVFAQDMSAQKMKQSADSLFQTNKAVQKTQTVQDIFNRLANKQQKTKNAESPVNSFFKKIFRP